MLMLLTELFYIPNGIIVELLNSVTDLWIDLLSFGKKTWFVGLQYKFFIFSFIPLILAFMIVKTFEKQEYKVLGLGLLLISSILIGRYALSAGPLTLEVATGKCSAKIVINDKKLIVEDNGIFSKRSARSDIKYKILPEIIKITGVNAIDRLVLKSLGKRTLSNLEYANSLLSIKEIDLSYCKNKPAAILFCELNNFCVSESINLVS